MFVQFWCDRIVSEFINYVDAHNHGFRYFWPEDEALPALPALPLRICDGLMSAVRKNSVRCR